MAEDTVDKESTVIESAVDLKGEDGKALAPQSRALEHLNNERERIANNKKLLLFHLDQGLGIVGYACSKVGISYTTFYHYCRKDAEFKRLVEEIRTEKQPRVVEDKLLKLINEDNVPAILFYLKSRHKDYKPKLGLEGEIGLYNPYAKLTDEQIKERARKLIGKLGGESG